MLTESRRLEDEQTTVPSFCTCAHKATAVVRPWKVQWCPNKTGINKLDQ